MNPRCECADPGCPVHINTRCGYEPGVGEQSKRLYRRDEADPTGTYFCGPCASAALESGLFITREIDERRKPTVTYKAREMLEAEKRAPRTGTEMEVGEEAWGVSKDVTGRWMVEYGATLVSKKGGFCFLGADRENKTRWRPYAPEDVYRFEREAHAAVRDRNRASIKPSPA